MKLSNQSESNSDKNFSLPQAGPYGVTKRVRSSSLSLPPPLQGKQARSLSLLAHTQTKVPLTLTSLRSRGSDQVAMLTYLYLG